MFSMIATFFYFSGTGNSLDIAKRIADTLGFGVIRSISKYRNAKSVENYDDMIGFIFLVYSQIFPGILKRFIKKLEPKSNPYIFSIETNNGGPGRANYFLLPPQILYP
jgi:flavodoxin